MNGVLVDTSVWVEHFRMRNGALETLLECDLVLMHPMVIGEIACGTPPSPRTGTLADLGVLPTVQQASLNETVAFIERESLDGKGCGLVDMVLLASTLITPGTALWTHDRRLADIANRFGVLYETRAH